MSKYYQIFSAIILIVLSSVTLFKLFQEPVSEPLIFLVLAVIFSAFLLPGLKFKSVKYKDIQLEFDDRTGRKLDDVTVINPYGEQEIILNGQMIQVVNAKIDEIDLDNYTVNKKYGFALAKPDVSLELESKLVSFKQYIDYFESTQGGIDMLLDMPIIRESKIFRIWHKDPLHINFKKESYVGEYISDKELAAYARLLKQQHMPELQNFAKTTLFEFSQKQFNELAVMICPRNIVEASLVLDTLGRKVELTPINYVMRFGGVPPRLDLLNVKQASVSYDGNVWGFYGTTSYHNIIVDGIEQPIVYSDFYRIFLMNQSYVYQISLNYIPAMKYPRVTWDELVRLLQSLRIVVK